MATIAKRGCGFLLIEALTSLILLLFLMQSLCSWHLFYMKEQAAMVMKTKALLFAIKLLEHVRAYKKIPIVKDTDYTISWNIQPIANLTNFKKIEIIISWHAAECKSSLALVTGAFLEQNSRI